MKKAELRDNQVARGNLKYIVVDKDDAGRS